jgi:hypothetical protein
MVKQKTCRGIYDETHQKYQTKCEFIKCFGKFHFNCGLNSNNICSKNLTECNEYNKIILNKNVKILIGLEPSLNIKINNNEKDKIKNFNKHIQNCKNTIYKLNTNDFCLNGLNCMERFVSPTALGYNYVKRKIDCKCPNEKGFKCGKYCTKDSNACDFLKSNKTSFVNIDKCGNNNVSIFRSFFHFI